MKFKSVKTLVFAVVLAMLLETSSSWPKKYVHGLNIEKLVIKTNQKGNFASKSGVFNSQSTKSPLCYQNETKRNVNQRGVWV